MDKYYPINNTAPIADINKSSTPNVRFSFALRLILFSFVLVIVSALIIAYLTFQDSEKRLEHYLGVEVDRIAKTAGLMIDGNLLENIFYVPDFGLQGQADFDLIQKQLIAIRDTNELEHRAGLSPIYILRKHIDFSSNQLLEFVVMTNKDKQGHYFVGATYKIEEHHKLAFEGKAKFTPIYQDTEGSWVSAATPIYNDQQEIIAILQVDRPVNFYHQQLNAILSVYQNGGIYSLLCGIFLSVIFSWLVLKPIKLLVKYNELLGSGDYSSRIDKKRSDEFGLLFENFNRMAASLQERKIADDKQLKQMMEVITQLDIDSQQMVVIASSTNAVLDRQVGHSHDIKAKMGALMISINTVQETSKQAMQYTQESAEQADLMLNRVDEMEVSALAVGESAQQTASMIQQLVGQGKEISVVLDIISHIADETNLLALNASIEAARAGDVGRGFAVVASEIRNLAKKTHEQAETVQKVVVNIQQSIQQGKERVEETVTNAVSSTENAIQTKISVTQIADNLNNISDINNNLSTIVEECYSFAENANQNANLIVSEAENTKANVDAINGSSQALVEIACQLQVIGGIESVKVGKRIESVSEQNGSADIELF